MPKFNVVVDHEISREDAVDRLKGFSEHIRKEAPVEVKDVQEFGMTRESWIFRLRRWDSKSQEQW